MDPKTDEEAELIRKKYLYRQLILSKRVTLPRTSATRLIGPDCAYHLYARLKPSMPDENEPSSSKDG